SRSVPFMQAQFRTPILQPNVDSCGTRRWTLALSGLRVGIKLDRADPVEAGAPVHFTSVEMRRGGQRLPWRVLADSEVRTLSCELLPRSRQGFTYERARVRGVWPFNGPLPLGSNPANRCTATDILPRLAFVLQHRLCLLICPPRPS